jgi:hypothetical protein
VNFDGEAAGGEVMGSGDGHGRKRNGPRFKDQGPSSECELEGREG